jgi:hypothetical protein
MMKQLEKLSDHQEDRAHKRMLAYPVPHDSTMNSAIQNALSTLAATTDMLQ